MWRAPRRCAPFTCTSACWAGSSITMGSGSVASPSPSARKPRSTAPTATAKGILSRNASSGTTRMSVGEYPLQAPLRFGERFLEVMQLLTEPEAEVARQTEVLAWDEQNAVLGAHLLHQLEGDDPTDSQAGQAVRLGQPVHDDRALIAAPERRRRRAVALRALVHFVGEQPRPDFRRA